MPCTKVLVYDTSGRQCEPISTGLMSLHRGIEVKCVRNFDSMIALLTGETRWVVIVSDPVLSGATASFAKLLHTRFPQVPVVFLLQEGRRDQVVAAFRLGARGIVYSTDSQTNLAKCIDSVSEGELWVRHADLGLIFEGLSKPGERMTGVSRRPLLSPREDQISRLVAEGMSNRDVSKKLQISESTVKNSLFHVFDKLGIANRVELARYVNSVSK